MPRARAIQIPLCVDFGSIWEYRAAFIRAEIDFAKAVGPVCPICGQEGCWRRISPYRRNVIELFPFREDVVEVARFQCTKERATFSLLPVQLIPYFRYTASSVVGAMLAMWILIRRDGPVSFGRLVQRDSDGDGLDADSQVTAWLLETWLQAVLTGLRRAHRLLAIRPKPCGLSGGKLRADRVREAASYFLARGVRAPPQHAHGVIRILERHGRLSGQFLLGTPSQAQQR